MIGDLPAGSRRQAAPGSLLQAETKTLQLRDVRTVPRWPRKAC